MKSMKLIAFCTLLIVLVCPALGSEIHEAVIEGDVAAVKSLLRSNPSCIHERDDSAMHNLPLLTAAISGNVEIAQLLLDAGADVNCGDTDNSTPLDDASVLGRAEMVAFLLTRGANVHHRDNKGDTALSFAVSGNSWEVAQLLLDAGSDLFYRSPDGRTLMHTAARVGMIEMIDHLLEQGIPADEMMEHGDTPLGEAARRGHIEIMTRLIDAGADLNASNAPYKFWSPLRKTVTGGQLEAARLLLERGADVAFACDEHETPLTSAYRTDNLEIARLLIEHGSDVNQVSPRGETALVKAVESNRADLVALLLANGARQDVGGSRNGNAPLQIACLQGYTEVAGQLIAAGADVNTADGTAYKPLQLATRYGHDDLARYLVEKGAGGKAEVDTRFTLTGQRKVGKREAAVWHLGHAGWAVKTRKHLLIFDYYPGMSTPPANPGLANGFINPSELKDENVIVFASHHHRDHYDPAIFEWADQIDNITYFIGCEVPDRDDYIEMAPRQTYKEAGVEVKTIFSTDAGVGMVVEVDGLTIFHGGDHSNGRSAGCPNGLLPAYTNEIDWLKAEGVKPDMAFMGIRGCSLGDPEEVKLGVHYAFEHLKPKVFFPQHAGGNYQTYSDWISTNAASYQSIKMMPAVARGDLFRYEKGTIARVDMKGDKRAAGSCAGKTTQTAGRE
ncbi:MAG: hypothetical protein GY835_07435 [bacterium]|nr:hypothetical protein [bacterium]